MEYFLRILTKEIQTAFAEILEVNSEDVVVESPNPKFDADLVVPLFRFAGEGKSPPDLAKSVAEKFSHSGIEKAEAVSGFVNLTLKADVLASEFFNDIEKALKANKKYGENELYKDQEIVVEFTDPNPFKELHIGHAYSNSVGESLSRLMEAAGAKAHRVTYGGDVGLHVAKAIYGIQKLSSEESVVFKNLPEEKRAEFLGRAYAAGAQAYESDEAVKDDIQSLNLKIYQQSDPEINEIHELGRTWSYDYFDSMYHRLGTKFERHFKESEAAPKGTEMVKVGLEKQVFEESDGAVVFRGESHGLHTRVFLNSDGIPMYEAKDLGLMFLKDDEYHYDKSIILTGNEQAEYFKVMLKAASMIQAELADKTTHLSHGIVKLSSGKMSSRTGEVVTARELLDTVEKTLKELNPEAPALTENTLGSFKYAMLKHNLGSDIVYDVEESLDVQGNSGPYVQYAAVRVGSILSKAGDSVDSTDDYDWKAERKLLMIISQYPETVVAATKEYEPHLICNFVYELARELNRYYENVPVLDSSNDEKAFRIKLLKSIQEVLKHSLGLLNIPIPEKM